MKKEDVFEVLSSTEAGARLLIEAIIGDYGVQDFLQCVFWGLNEADQTRFLDSAIKKAGVEA